ncbi:MAG TPA: MFS transporter [Stellaceae bacterium]|nr:MFS transporter [Stellaceae bacterium]
MITDDGLPIPRRHWATLTMALAITLAVLDGAIANIALPTIAEELQVSAAASIWVVNAYQIAVTIALLPLASLGDIYGYRRVFKIGLAVFTAASLACALSDSLVMLSIARIIQGFGAAGIMSVNAALVRYIYPRDRLGRGIAMVALTVAVSSAISPSIAAAVLSVASWHWLFAINVPIGILGLLTSGTLPRTDRAAHRFDVGSAFLNALTFGLVIAGIDGLGHGENPIRVGAELAVAALAGIVLVRRQLSRPAPLLPIDLLRLPVFALSIATSICSFIAAALALVSLPFYLQTILGRSQVETGLLMTPWPVTVAIVAPIAGRLADRYSAGVLGGIGLVIFAVGLALTAGLPIHPTSADIVWRMIICGFGFALFQSPNNRAMIGAAPRHRSGAAGGMLSTARLLGQTTGALLVGMIFGLLPGMGAGTTVALIVAACFAGAAALVSCARMVDFPAPSRAAPDIPIE